jgi:eukaryotic-like serine/threonine-protein kinase
MATQEVKVCPTCGNENSVSTKTCPVCGNKNLTNVPVTRVPVAAPANQPVPSPPPQGAPETVRLPELGSAPGTAPLSPFPPPTSRWERIQQRLADNQRRLTFGGIALIFLLLLIVIVLIFRSAFLAGGGTASSTATPAATPTPVPGAPKVLGEFTASNGDTIGVNDGSFAPFDTLHDPQEVALKQQAAQALHAGNRARAESLWQQALNIDTSDAEALINLENQHVLESGRPYLTLVVCVNFVSTNDPSNQRQLQGIYVAQHEHNSLSSPFKLRILIANSGNDVANAALVAQQIVYIAAQDKTIVGVIGWSTSSRSHEALTIFANAKLPQVSSQASDDALSGISPYYFRIVPPNKVQAPAAAAFAEKTLKVKNLVVFLDPNDNYSQNLASDFERQLVRDGFPHPHEETFKTDDKNNKANFATLIQDALNKYNPDAFYFASASNADTGAFQDGLPTSGPFANLPVISGDAGYSAHKNAYNRWYFLAYAYPDEWRNILKGNTPPFFQDYPAAFNPNGIPNLSYGYTRPDDRVILSYDATQILLTGIQMALRTHDETKLTPQDLANALPQISGAQTYQGISGQIAFDANHDPINKAMVFVYTSPDGHLQMKSWQGCFTIKVCL